MTADAGASTVMEDVVCSAISNSLTARPPRPLARLSTTWSTAAGSPVSERTGWGPEPKTRRGNVPHVREYSTPSTMEPPSSGNLTDDVVTNARAHAEAVVFSRPSADGWVGVSAATFHEEVCGVAKGLVAAGIEAGDRVALMSKTRYEWTLLDYAIWFAGAITVPIYETSSAEQVQWILSDSGTKAVVAEGSEHIARISEIRGELTALNHVWSFADNGVDVLTRLGADVSDEEIEKRRSSLTPDDTATLIYTSGTTGRPKGCILTHGNFMFELG